LSKKDLYEFRALAAGNVRQFEQGLPRPAQRS
jgi:hypothetical protein